MGPCFSYEHTHRPPPFILPLLTGPPLSYSPCSQVPPSHTPPAHRPPPLIHPPLCSCLCPPLPPSLPMFFLHSPSAAQSGHLTWLSTHTTSACTMTKQVQVQGAGGREGGLVEGLCLSSQGRVCVCVRVCVWGGGGAWGGPPTSAGVQHEETREQSVRH